MSFLDGSRRGEESGVGQGHVPKDTSKLTQQLWIVVGMHAQQQEHANGVFRQGLHAHSTATILQSQVI